MRLPRDLSGADLVHRLCLHFGYRRVHQRGSHVILETDTPSHHRIAIPEHDALRVGTLNAIVGAVARAKGIDKTVVVDSLQR
jgi:predicted RNA binding protein YcfA (HicA-like mRNA interferase family)